MDDERVESIGAEVTGTFNVDGRVDAVVEGIVRRSANCMASFVPDAFPTQCERKNV